MARDASSSLIALGLSRNECRSAASNPVDLQSRLTKQDLPNREKIYDWRVRARISGGVSV